MDGLEIHRPQCHRDNRGWLIEFFRQDELRPDQIPCMAYVSMTLPGVVRGPHEHRHQTDIICFAGPSNFTLQLWDNRPNSPTYGKSRSLQGGEDKPLIVIIPPGIVHAYRNIGQVEGLVLNAPNRLYAGDGRQEDVDEIRYEDQPDCPFKLEI